MTKSSNVFFGTSLLVILLLTGAAIVVVNWNRRPGLDPNMIGSIKLGDSRESVVSRLGQPHEVEALDELWYLYSVQGAGDPFKVSFDETDQVTWASF